MFFIVLSVNSDFLHRHCNGTGERDEVLADYNNLTKIVESKKNMEADKKKLFLLFSRMFDVNATGNLNMTNEENLKDAATKLSNQIERPHAAVKLMIRMC